LLHAPAPAVTTQPAYTLNPPKTSTVKPASFKVEDLPEDPSTSNPPETSTIKPVLVLLASPAVAILTSAPTFITPMISAPASAELISSSTPPAT
jgi:hypothetical protein